MCKSELNDFIDGDVLHDTIHDNLNSLFDYKRDDQLPSRTCPDQAVNSYGLKIIQL